MTVRTDNANSRSLASRPAAGLTLIELLIVVSLIAILTAVILPQFTTSDHAQLESVAHWLSADLAYGRNLAVSNDSTYRFRFDVAENRYVLGHSGANSLLDVLPPSSLRRPDDPPDQQSTDLDEIPHVGPTVRLAGVYRLAGTPTAVTDLEFGPLGETTRNQPTMIWLAWGQGTDRRYLSVRVDPITGLASIDRYQSEAPP